MKNRYRYEVYLYEGRKKIFDTFSRKDAFVWKSEKTFIIRTDYTKVPSADAYKHIL